MYQIFQLKKINNIILDGKLDGKFIVESDWTIIQYNESPDSFEKMRTKVKELGFVLTDNEEKEWDKYISEMDD